MCDFKKFCIKSLSLFRVNHLRGYKEKHKGKKENKERIEERQKEQKIAQGRRKSRH